MNFASLWRTRAPREKTLIGAGFALAAAILVATLVWLPLERARDRSRMELPRLRAAAATLAADADEVRRLRALPATVATSSAPLAQLVSTNALAKDLAGAQLTLADAGHVRLSAADVGFAALLDALVAANAANGLRVESARIEALPAPGRVRAELTLARP